MYVYNLGEKSIRKWIIVNGDELTIIHFLASFPVKLEAKPICERIFYF